MAARADRVSRVDHDGVTLVEGTTSNVRFAFTERTGGVSEEPYSSLNLGSHVGDDPFPFKKIVVVRLMPWELPSANTTCLFPIRYMGIASLR